MKKDIRYSFEYNGLVFDFDYAKRSVFNNTLWFYRKCTFSSSNYESICFIDLSKCSLKFDSHIVKTDFYYFTIIPVGGASYGRK